MTDTAHRPPIWRRPKYKEPARAATRPRPGTATEVAHRLLSRPEGVLLEEFCAIMTPLKGEGTLPWEPSKAWSKVTWLLCSLNGYGMRFDGERLFLIMPREAELPSRSRSAAQAR